MDRTYALLILALVASCVGGSACAQQPRDDRGGPPPGGDVGMGVIDRQVGLITHTDEASPGYTLVAPKHFLYTYLLDNNGGVVNAWASQYEPGQSAYLLPNGNLLRASFIKGGASIGGGEGGRVEEYDWDGNLVWEFNASGATAKSHHDIEPLPNGNVLLLVTERKTIEECITAGFRADALRQGELLPDSVYEIEPTYPEGGRVVWEWHVWDHLIQNRDPAGENYGQPSEHPERIWVECNGNRGAASFWNHMNSIDYNAELDQVMLSVRGSSEVWIIDHSTTTEEARGDAGGRSGKGGGLLYRWGNPAAFDRADVGHKALYDQHDTQWVPEGQPGAGNILVFNNGLGRVPPGTEGAGGRGQGYSSVDEFTPPMDADGNYVIDPVGVYGPPEFAWSYADDNPTDFFAEAISGCQRLPNGNTLICDGTSGVLFEVTPDMRKVWEYVCPVTGDGPIGQGDPIPIDGRGHAMNAVFKVVRYPADYIGLAGRDLTPTDELVGLVHEYVPENLSNQAPPNRGGGAGR